MSAHGESLSPERRFRLYSKIADAFDEAGEPEAAARIRILATTALRESPTFQTEVKSLLNELAGGEHERA